MTDRAGHFGKLGLEFLAHSLRVLRSLACLFSNPASVLVAQTCCEPPSGMPHVNVHLISPSKESILRVFLPNTEKAYALLMTTRSRVN